MSDLANTPSVCMYKDTRECQKTPECVRRHPSVNKDTPSVYEDTRVWTKTHRVCTKTPGYVRRHPSVDKDTPSVYEDTRVWTKTHRVCTKTPEYVRRHPSTYEDTQSDSGSVMVGKRTPYTVKIKSLVIHSQKTAAEPQQSTYSRITTEMYYLVCPGHLFTEDHVRRGFLLSSTATIRSGQ